MLLRAGVEREGYSNTSERGADINFVKKIIQKNIKKYTEILPQLITQPGREKQDKRSVLDSFNRSIFGTRVQSRLSLQDEMFGKFKVQKSSGIWPS